MNIPVIYNPNTGESVYYIPIYNDADIMILQEDLDKALSMIDSGEVVRDNKHDRLFQTGEVIRYNIWCNTKYKPLHEIYAKQKAAEDEIKRKERSLAGGSDCMHKNYTPIGEYHDNDGWVDARCNDCKCEFRKYYRTW
jgi:hypothetical protein